MATVAAADELHLKNAIVIRGRSSISLPGRRQDVARNAHRVVLRGDRANIEAPIIVSTATGVEVGLARGEHRTLIHRPLINFTSMAEWVPVTTISAELDYDSAPSAGRVNVDRPMALTWVPVLTAPVSRQRTR